MSIWPWYFIKAKDFRLLRMLLLLSLIPRLIYAFVILDTSANNPVFGVQDSLPRHMTPSASSEIPKLLQGEPTTVLPHYGTVLFLSSDSKMIYAYIGVLKALEEYGLDVDIVVTESKAALVGAAWTLGYRTEMIEKLLVAQPIEDYLKPFSKKEMEDDNQYVTDGIAPRQWSIPLSLPSLQTSGIQWAEIGEEQPGEYLQLSWLIAKLTHDAPDGPVEDLQATPRPLAFQVSNLGEDQEEVVTNGSLQNLLKGAALPENVLQKRKSLWPFASGSIRSGHRILADKLPFTFDKLILIHAGAHLLPPLLDGHPLAWADSVRMKRSDAGDDILTQRPWNGKVIQIEMEPSKDFAAHELDAHKWVDLGYVSTLRNMDVLLPSLSKKSVSVPAPGATVPPIFHTNLALNRVSVNPLASGGRQLLLDLIRTSEKGENDSLGDGPITEILKSGFYTDLDLEWTRAVGEEMASIVFDAKDKSQFRFQAGWNAAVIQAEISDRSPELYGGLTWDEPFYIPFRSDISLLLGGHRPGYQAKFLIAPLYPLRLDLGVEMVHWEIQYPHPPSAGYPLNPVLFGLKRDLGEVFLKIYPSRGTYLRTSIQKHEMVQLDFSESGEGEYLSTDFEETGFIGLGQTKKAIKPPHSLRIRYRKLNRINLFGPIKHTTSNLEVRLRLSLGNFRFSDQYYWSNQKLDGATIFDMLESGRIDAFTFQDEYFLGSLRTPNFQDVKLEYCPVFGQAGIRLILGGYRQYGSASFFPDQIRRPIRFHWETQAGYATPLGYLRAGMGARVGELPFYYLKLGADLGLGFGEVD